MNIKDRIRKEINVQESIEGEKCQKEILLRFLDAVRTQAQWYAFISIEFYQYGKLSYECHRFYYPKEELLKIMK